MTYKPPMTGAFLELTTGLGTANGSSRILSAYANAHEESPCRQDVEHANRVALEVRSGGQRGEDDEDDGGHDQGVLARPVITQEPEQELTHDRAGEGNVGDVGLGRGVVEGVAILRGQDSVDRADDL